MRRRIGLVVGGALVAWAAAASAQTQIKARVLIMVDTSGSMTEHFTDNDATGGDGSTFYSDAIMTRQASADGNNGMYVGFTLPANQCPGTAYDGVNSRLFAAKQAVTNVVNGAGDIDWGLMRYSGTQCPVVNTVGANGAGCTSDDRCPVGQFCIAGNCKTDDNLCFLYGFTFAGGSAGYGATRRSGGGCLNRFNNGDAMTYQGSCGTGVAADDPTCATPQICYSDADCNAGTAGSCVPLPGSSAKACKCTGGPTCDGTLYICGGGGPAGFCNYHLGCQNPGGVILVDPSSANPSPQVLPYVDGVEALPGNIAGVAVNPELRATNGTPLAGAARSATSWYNNIKNTAADPQITCRPYVLVQMTDGFDSCDADINNGPVASAGAFVAATVANAKNLNKVYVIGLAFGTNPSPTLDAIAHAGGTGAARLANSQSDIQAALADIVSSSVLTEKCNRIDDNCNGQCDENFPGVLVTNPAPDGSSCSNPHPASSCNNGYPAPSGAGTGHCYDADVFVCSADQLSQVCNAQTCIGAVGGTISCPGGGVMRVSNVNGLTSSMIGQLLVVGGASALADNGAFVITAVGATTVDVTNPACVASGTSVSYGVPTMQGKATITAPGGGIERLTLTAGATTKINVGDNIIVTGALPAADNGTFTVGAVTATTIDLVNAAAVAGTQAGAWADPRLCPGVETCNGIDDDCNGVIDDCAPNVGIAGSCCTSNCPACAKPPFVETCNGCDDDCDGVVDNHLVDVNQTCGNNTGNCAPGKTACCQEASPSVGSCTQDQTQPPSSNKDRLVCLGGNPPYPTPGFDFCDGTDDNCNGVPNDGPPQNCCVDQSTGTPFNCALDGIGACHHGTQPCTTTPLGPGSPPCPVGWPAGKVCPNPTHTYGACTGGVGPHVEVCNKIDDDCNGIVDDNLTDPWLNTACCSTGNNADCTNTGGSMQCKLGTWQCVNGAKTCVGSVAKQPEICDKIDNDCNGIVDDLPGKGSPCSGGTDPTTGQPIYTQGTCRATLKCVYAPQMGASPNLVCTQDTGPKPEVCNGLDDNCNGLVDDTQPPLAPPGGVLPGTGTPCMVPMPPADKPPCKPGTNVCQAGMIVCVGAVGPMPNQCNGISTDCTGMPNNNGNCPSGFFCNQGNCVAACDPGEFPCPGGYVCQKSNPACGMNGCCIPDACANVNCPTGFICQVDNSGNAQCKDPCASVNCPMGYLCKQGVCVDASCRTQGCPSGQICTDAGGSPTCVPDPCANVTCTGNQYCKGGTCVGTCAGPCPNGQYCDKGQCASDPCAKVPCLEGQVCVPQNGVGVCVENSCTGGCGLLQACCGGACISDPCLELHCPEDTHCSLNSACQASCETNPASPKDAIVGAGGGGFSCAVAEGHASSPASLALLLLALVTLVLRRRTRAAEVRR